jgi:hypothetical protein
MGLAKTALGIAILLKLNKEKIGSYTNFDRNLRPAQLAILRAVAGKKALLE